MEKDLKLQKIFETGYTFVTIDSKIRLSTINIGDIILISGKIVACDPTWITTPNPLSIRVIPGKYPIIVSVARIYRNKSRRVDQRIAGAMIRFNNNALIKWELAFSQNTEQSLLEPSQSFGYIVDGGIGSFIDFDACKTLVKEVQKWTNDVNSNEANFVQKMINEVMEKHWSIIELDNTTKTNIVAFEAGFGDNIYPCYFGYDQDENVCCLATDFLIVN